MQHHEAQRPTWGQARRRSLPMGLACGGVGLVVSGILVILGGSTAGSGWTGLLLAAPLGGFATGFLLWLLLVARRPAPDRLQPVLVGALAGVASHWTCWYMMLLIQQVRYLALGETGSLGDPPMDLLTGLFGAAVYSFWSLIVIGWATAPAGALLGWFFGRRERTLRHAASSHS